jgi:DNA-binding transcriptional regulator YiaG
VVKRHKSLLSPEHAHIGRRLGDARDAVKLSQSKVASLLGESQTWVSKIETGRRWVDGVELRRLVLLYKTDANSIIMPDYPPAARPAVAAGPRAVSPRVVPFAPPPRPPMVLETPKRGRPRGAKMHRPSYRGPRPKKRPSAPRTRRPKS